MREKHKLFDKQISNLVIENLCNRKINFIFLIFMYVKCVLETARVQGRTYKRACAQKKVV